MPTSLEVGRFSPGVLFTEVCFEFDSMVLLDPFGNPVCENRNLKVLLRPMLEMTLTWFQIKFAKNSTERFVAPCSICHQLSLQNETHFPFCNRNPFHVEFLKFEKKGYLGKNNQLRKIISIP